MTRLNNLGDGLRVRYLRKGNIQDLQDALELMSRAVKITPESSPELRRNLTNLGAALLTQYDLTNQASDLEKALLLLSRGKTLYQSTAPERPYVVNFLSKALRLKYEATQNVQDLQDAAENAQEAVDASNVSSLMMPNYLADLAACFHTLYERENQPRYLEQAVTLYRRTCVTGLELLPEVTLKVSQWWGDWALRRRNWAEAVEAFEHGSEAISRLIRVQLTRLSRETWLQDAQRLPSLLAYARAQTGDAAGAMLALENNRTRLLSEALEVNRMDLERLREIGQSDLYERYRKASAQVTNLTQSHSGLVSAAPVFDNTAELRHARSELDSVIQSIQQVSGYQDFFGQLSLDEILEVFAGIAQGEPHKTAGIYLTVTQTGGLALIVDETGVRPVWLDTNEQELDTWLVQSGGDDTRGGYLIAQLGGAPLDYALNRLLPLIGEKLILPCVMALNEQDSRLGRKTSALVLIPSGRLALLPLHAAIYSVNEKPQQLLPERTVFWAPSARAFRNGQLIIEVGHHETPSLFAVANPQPMSPDNPSLIFASLEVEEVVLLFNSCALALHETEALASSVKQHFDTSTYLHLSCHGFFNPVKPLSSGIIFSHDEIITLEYLISQQPFKHTRLAVLSACETAIADFQKLPEEAIGLPAGFLQAGVPGVVGSLWPVNDLSTALIMIKFYQFHLQNKLHPAYALRYAQLWLRDVTCAELGEFGEHYAKRASEVSKELRESYSHMAQSLKHYALRSGNYCPFSHPYYWAPFVFYGV